MRYIEDANARADDTAQPQAALWDDGADPTAELIRLMTVRQSAIDRFGLSVLAAGEPMVNLRRRFVPVWLLHRYQMAAAAKSIGGVDLSYAVNGGGHEVALPVPPQAQRTALDAVLATLSPDVLRVPQRLMPLLSAARNASPNRQYDIELFASAEGTPFDPLVAADAAAELTLAALLAPARLARLDSQHAADPNALGVDELLDRLQSVTLANTNDALTGRIAYRTVISMAQVEHDPKTTPGVAAILDARVHDIATSLAHRGGSKADQDWASSLSRRLLDPQQLDKLLAERPRAVNIPPGPPIGSESDWMTMPGDGVD